MTVEDPHTVENSGLKGRRLVLSALVATAFAAATFARNGATAQTAAPISRGDVKMTQPKVIVLCNRKSGLRDEELRAKQAEHAEMVRAFTEGVVTAYAYGFPTATPDGNSPLHDLVVEVSVTSFEAYFAAIQTEGGQAAVAHAGTYLSDVSFMLVEPQQIWG